MTARAASSRFNPARPPRANQNGTAKASHGRRLTTATSVSINMFDFTRVPSRSVQIGTAASAATGPGEITEGSRT